MPGLLACPRCPDTFTLSADDPDATLSEVHEHLRRTHDLEPAEALEALSHVTVMQEA